MIKSYSIIKKIKIYSKIFSDKKYFHAFSFSKTNIWFEITNLLIPGENDSPEEINFMTEWIVENLGSDIPLHFSAFHPEWKMQNYKITPHSKLTRSREIALANGLRYVYLGNVHDKYGSSTYCYNCKK